MSDCSTNAMKPKDMDLLKSPNVSKTCGSCGHVYQVVLNCHYADNDGRYYARATRSDVRACEDWVPNQDSLEQHYEQLEQVAMNMFYDLDPYCAFPYREQLEALGVMVDE